MKDYYHILGIAKNASDEDVKKAFRRLAHQHHPDKAHGNEQKFKEINEAYQVLSNRQKREQYDRFGTVGDMPSGFGGQGFPGGFDFSGFPGSNGFRVDFGSGEDFGDIFETIFGNAGGRARRPVYERGSDVQAVHEISLEDAYKGVMREFSVKTLLACEKCGGKGGDTSAGTKKCSTCNGRGEVRVERRSFFGNFSQVTICAACRGAGEVPVKGCMHCKGAGRVAGERAVTVELLPGIQDGQLIQVKGAGEAGERGTGTGDLYVKVRVKKHSIFERSGDDLIVKKELRLSGLLLGKKLGIPTIEGHTLKVEIPEHFNLKENLRIPSEGMPHFGTYGRGDLLVDFILKAPKKVDGKIAKLLEELE